jgi:hypothetical protein
MPVFEIEFDGLVVTEDEQLMSTDVLDTLTDKLIEKLLELKDAIDPDIGATLSKGELRIRLSVAADQAPQAYEKAFDLVQKALDAVQLRPDWRPEPGWLPKARWSVQDHGWHITPSRQREDHQDLIEA